MRIGILGPLEVRDETGRPVAVSGPRLRALLARLVIEAGRAVSAERLLDDLWEGAPPAGGAGALQAPVSRLRGAAGRDLVEYGPAGYRLAVDPAEIDAVAFERAVAAARRERGPGPRAEGLRHALGLWRGPALADVADAAFATPEAARLGALRLAAIEDRADAELTLGHPAAPLVQEIEALAEAHPLRERLLMRALYAAGRQADALRVYEETRRELADRLGVDPSPELAAAHLSEHRQPPQYGAFGVVEQFPAPVDDSAERPVPWQCGAAAAGEQPEPVTETARDLCRGQRPQPGRRQLDGERDAVELAADGHDVRRRRVVHREAGADRGGAVGEQPHRRVPQRFARVGAGGRQRERRNGAQHLAGDAEGLAARRQHPYTGGLGERASSDEAGQLGGQVGRT
ncbi:hypothetical protein GCM10010411_95690 [Actinomadura fulvescens]|uniref:OmpR/PhoB-type domain-containing protein n=1 Tax=Actinomadura fulvescens TaxID=46160 RepID=A0ABP6DGM2_9ACTN